MTPTRTRWMVRAAAMGFTALAIAGAPAAADTVQDSAVTDPLFLDGSTDALILPEEWGPETPGEPRTLDDTESYRSHSDVPDLPDGLEDDPPVNGPSAGVFPGLTLEDPFGDLSAIATLESDNNVRNPLFGEAPFYSAVPTPGVGVVVVFGLGALGGRRRR